MTEAVEASPEHPVLIDKFLEDAIEVDVDAVCDGADDRRRGDGAHRGGRHPLRRLGVPDPAVRLSDESSIGSRTSRAASRGGSASCGLMNIQFAVKDGEIYVLEVNPRASRTVPFVSKATGLNLAQVAARVMAGRTLAEQGIAPERPRSLPPPAFTSVKEAVFPSPSSRAWTSCSAPRCARPAR